MQRIEKDAKAKKALKDHIRAAENGDEGIEMQDVILEEIQETFPEEINEGEGKAPSYNVHPQRHTD